jgi:hypothetical protein
MQLLPGIATGLAASTMINHSHVLSVDIAQALRVQKHKRSMSKSVK